MIYMISGLHDPRWLSNILDNYNRQTYRYKRLIIVENGNGIGCTSTISLPKNTIVLKSNPGPGQYINVGIEYLKQFANNDWFCKCDSDDYYGPKYLHKIRLAQKSGADYAGSNKIYIKTMEDKLWYVENNSTSIFHGPTLAAHIKSTLSFPLVKEWGEDALWCKSMKAANKIAYVLEPESFCYQRWTNYNHTWPCTDIELRTSWQTQVLDLGIFDYDIVNGIKKPITKTILDVIETNYTNFMPFRILKEQSLKSVGL